MDYKDTIIEELLKENHALKHGPHNCDVVSSDLRVAEETLATSIDRKALLEADLRSQDDANTVHIQRIDADRTHLKAIELSKRDEIARLTSELVALRAQVNRKRDDFDHAKVEYSQVMEANHNLKKKVCNFVNEIKKETDENVILQGEQNRVNDGIGYNKKNVESVLIAENSRSRDNQAAQKAKLDDLTGRNFYLADQIVDRNAKINVLNDDLNHRMLLLDDLKAKINAETDNTIYISRDNDGYAVRNRELDSTVSRLRVRLEDGKVEIAALRASLVDLDAANRYKQDTNYHLERDIEGLSTHIGTLSIHKNHIDHDLHHAADREAYLKGNYCKASSIHTKQRVYEDDLRHSASHVEYVRATSPARSPYRRTFY